MYYCILTPCANLDVATPDIGLVEANVNHIFSNGEHLKIHLMKWKYWPEGNFRGEPVFDDPEKEKYINSVVSELPEDKLYKCEKLSYNMYCCPICIYKTKELYPASEETLGGHGKCVMLTREEILLMFPEK